MGYRQNTVTVDIETYNLLKSIQADFIKKGKNARWKDIITELYELYNKETTIVCKYLKFNCRGASATCRTALKDLIPGDIRGSCPNNENPYIITPFCWKVKDARKEIRRQMDINQQEQ